MIDIHCHILPGIDDGARSMEEALFMARQAVEDGISCIVATPHFRYPIVPAEQLRHRTESLLQFMSILEKERLPLRILAGGEFQVNEAPLDTLEEFPEIMYPRGSADVPRSVLLELPPEADVLRAGDVLFQAQLKGNKAPERLVIAHPERQPGFVEHVEQIKELLDRGICLQFNVTTFTHTFWWRRYIKGVLALMAYAPSQVYLASDAHAPVHRPCRLTPAKKVIENSLGEAFWHKLTVENPASLLGVGM